MRKMIGASRRVLTRVYHWLFSVLTVCPSIQRLRRTKNRPLIARRGAPGHPPPCGRGRAAACHLTRGQHAGGNVSDRRLTASTINGFASSRLSLTLLGPFIATQLNSTPLDVELSCVGEVSIATRRRNSTRRRVELSCVAINGS